MAHTRIAEATPFLDDSHTWSRVQSSPGSDDHPEGERVSYDSSSPSSLSSSSFVFCIQARASSTLRTEGSVSVPAGSTRSFGIQSRFICIGVCIRKCTYSGLLPIFTVIIPQKRKPAKLEEVIDLSLKLATNCG